MTEVAQLAALADGTLPEDRCAAVEAAVAESPEWARLLEEQRWAVSVVRGVEVEAPVALRERVGRLRAPARRRRALRPVPIALAGALAAAVIAVVLALPSSAPSVGEVAALGLERPAEPAPPSAGRAVLAASESGVAFPDWAEKFGWRAVGLRRDSVDGRGVTTVYYGNDGGRVLAYTVVSGGALHAPSSSARSVVEGTVVRDYVEGSRRVVVWERGGHTCVLTGPVAVRRAVMLELAGWKGKGAVHF